MFFYTFLIKQQEVQAIIAQINVKFYALIPFGCIFIQNRRFFIWNGSELTPQEGAILAVYCEKCYSKLLENVNFRKEPGKSDWKSWLRFRVPGAGFREKRRA